MKKKLVALLLCLVMALSLIPTTVWAKESTSVPLTLTVSSYSAPFINGNTGQHTVNSYKAKKYISKSDVGKVNSSGSATARFVGSNETGWTLVIDVVIGNYKETWTTNARITNKDMSEATGYVAFGLSFNTSGGTSTYISISGAKELPTPAPVAPTANDLKDLVDIVCRTDEQHNTTSELKANTYATNGVQKEGNKFYWSAEINEANVANYVIDGHQADTGHQRTVKLIWNDVTRKWDVDKKATIYVKCTPAPVAPTANDLKDLVDIVCRTDEQHNTTSELKANTYATNGVQKEGNKFYWSAEINEANVANYVIDGHQADTGHQRTVKLIWNDVTRKWDVDKKATIYVKCTPAPVAPDYDNLETLLDGKVKMVCETDNSHNHTYGLLENTYNTSEVAKNANGVYTCTVTIINDSGVSEYIAKYNDDTNSKHEAGDTANDLTITLEYDKENSKWVVSATDNTAIIYVKCTSEQEAPKAPTAEDLKSIRGVLVDCLSDPQAITHSDMAFPFFENTYEVGDVVLDQETDQYTCVVTVTDPQAYVNSYDFMLGLMLGKTDLIHHVMQPTTQTPTVTLVYDETNGWQRPERTYATITAICMIKAPTAEDLENYKLVKVDCDTRISHGEKSYALLDGTFTTAVTVDKEGIFQCVITITQDGAKKYVEQYSKDLNKTHSLKELKDATITLKYEDNSWGVDDNDNSASILAKCSTGSNTTTGTDDGKTVTSQKTFDAGIALYAGLSILSLTGGALVIRKRKEF